jgi:hypothetical protein
MPETNSDNSTAGSVKPWRFSPEFEINCAKGYPQEQQDAAEAA